ncbi:hypothetical protein IWZ00DRAFT_45971 [Phyllosticta capitalensis]|uniref:Secreted protein NIS1 n=1 Tax=Phyllosticta capitalensis TaxID=121624 RepID=A0ABR1Z5K8_9PEZI
MRFTSILAAGASLLGLSSARLVGVKAPSTIKPGDVFTAQLVTENYIQSVTDVSVVFGLAPDASYGGSLGTFVGAKFLGEDQSNQLHNVNVSMIMPTTVQTGKQIFGAALYSLYGASTTPVISEFNVSVTIGDATSSDWVQSEGIVTVSA